MENNLVIYIISDSIGETAQNMVMAVAAQFPTLHPLDIRRYPFVEEEGILVEILNEAKKYDGVIVHTLVGGELVEIVNRFAQENAMKVIDYMSPLTQVIAGKTGESPLEEPGTLHKLDEDYFNRVAAIEFAVKYDDGKDPRGFLQADYVILGISRTSKTPLSMYLANRGYKVANLPLIPEIPLPDQLFKVDPKKLVALTSSLGNIHRIRKTRLETLGLEHKNSYSDSQRIQEELDYSGMIFKELGITPIAVDDKAIEEVAAFIESRCNITNKKGLKI